jgi:hypothetical protein
MPSGDPFRDSYAPLVYEFLLNNETILPFRDWLKTFTVKIAKNGMWTGSLTLFDRTGSLLESRLLIPGKTTIKFRWAWDIEPDALAEAPIYYASLTGVHPTYQFDGLLLVLDIASKGTPEQRLKGKSGLPRGVRGEWVGLPASVIAQQIAMAAGWASVVIEGGDAPVYAGDAMMLAGEDHIQYLTRLAKRATKRVVADANDPDDASAPCQVGFDCYVFRVDPDGTFRFHTASYNQQRNVAPPSVRDYTVYADLSGEVISFEVADNSVQAIVAGGLRSKLTGVDSDKGRAVSISGSRASGAQANVGVADGAGRGTPHEVAIYDIDGSDFDTTAYIAVPGRSRAEVIRQARAFHAAVAAVQVQATATVKGWPHFGIHNYVNFRYFDSAGARQYLSGYYRIVGIEHTVGPTWTTKLELTRAGLRSMTPGTKMTTTNASGWTPQQSGSPGADVPDE